MIQDIVLTVGSVVFIIALIPTVGSKEKPPLTTSLLTGSFLVIFSITYYTLDLLVSSVTTGILGLLWLYIGYQKHSQKKK